MMQLTTALLLASLVAAQTPVPPSQTAAAPALPTATSAASVGVLTVPVGTRIPLTLVTPIYSQSTKPGASARATVAFPVMDGNSVAIPAGSYVEGTVESVTDRAPHTHRPAVEIHFTRLVMANGYSVPLDGASAQAMLTQPEMGGQAVGELAFLEAPPLGAGFAPAQTEPQPAPLPQVGPSKGLVFGLSIGLTAGLVVMFALLRRHHGSDNVALFGGGWQFEMVLNTPLTLEGSQVTAAMAAQPAQ